jgi:two-component system NtrC family sensor kinase
MMRKKAYYSAITRRLVIVFFCLSVVPIVGFALVAKDQVEQTNIVKLQELANSTIEHRAEVISLFLKDRLALLRLLVSLYPEDFLIQQERLEQLFLALAPQGDIVDLQVIDSSGLQFAYVGPYRTMIEGKRYDEAAWFRETLISGVHVSDVFSGYRNVPHFVVAVTNPLKTLVLRATINSSIFNSLLHSAQLGPRGDAFIINQTGAFQTPSLLGDTELNREERQLISFDSRQGSLVTDDHVYTSHWIDNNRWLLVIKANIEDSFGYYIQVRNRIIMLVVAISVLAMLGATLASVAISRNLQRSDKEYGALSMQFAQVEKMATVGRLAAGIAHEINNPLQMITNQAGWIGELLPEEDPASIKNLEEYQKAVEQIKYHVRRAGTITHRLLGYSRKMSTQQERVSVNELVEETVSFVEREASYNHIAINRRFDHNLPAVMTDGPQLQQVFLNLINNAIDAVGQKGEITITTRIGTKGMLVIEFADSGPGIKPEALKQIFDPFFTTKQTGKGTGLGLYISYDIVQKLGGSIQAANGPKGGAVFTVEIPRSGLTENES